MTITVSRLLDFNGTVISKLERIREKGNSRGGTEEKNEKPGPSSQMALHTDRTTNSRPELLKGKQYLVKRPQSGLDTKTY
jgi:hypothetical protein